MFDPHSESLRMAVVGTGVMGRGIAQIAAQAGVHVLLLDALAGAAERAQATLAGVWAQQQDKGRMGAEAVAQAKAHIHVAADMQALADCDLVVEAIAENLEAKRQLFAALEAVVSPRCVLATNTSSLSVTSIAAACQHPGRVAGWHFFNPVPLMKIVEVIAATRTELCVVDALLALGKRCGHRAVRAQDTPGFIVNHAGRGYGTEALRLLGESVASPQVIDDVLRGQCGFKLGPFELFDLVGLDVSVPVMESIYRQYFDEPRYRPSPLAVQRLHAGLLGRKTGQGFYCYQDGTIVRPELPPRPDAAPGPVWVSQRHAAWGQACAQWLRDMGAQVDTHTVPTPDALCIVLPLGEDVTTAALAEGLDPARTVGLDWLVPQDRCAAVFANPSTSSDTLDRAAALLAPCSSAVRVLRDSAGLVSQRVLATIVNIGCDIAQQGVASPADIDAAVTLGLGYPRGPLAWGDALGASTVLQILQQLHASSGDPRYRPSPWLRRRAALGVSLLLPDPAV
ncbi:3-hydroxyacyl-CoA dehydrogenase [Curvibacter sp. APW13]|uniref:3-hydroxyacyl-CoA dehydrogenase n=1 Tax=Curvibacter sp. APW13 TaxID=3077236 RepID=UPI0028DFB137|nr:3-hydroxyacyl-CoA dehydrogenase [Curvibacter sp. APW13]MDT8992401.1 3-hydroxyacyl-CoA dehydrogenase [Curvibacter sp. APW13]